MLCAYAMAVGSIRASRRLFSSLYTAMMRAPAIFFHFTPHGRIINRVSHDISCVDSVVPFTLRSLINSVLAVFASILVVALVTPLFLIPILPLAVIYYYIQVKCFACEPFTLYASLLSSLTAFLWIAEHGIATACRLSVCLSGMRYSGHIGCNSSKIISR